MYPLELAPSAFGNVSLADIKLRGLVTGIAEAPTPEGIEGV